MQFVKPPYIKREYRVVHTNQSKVDLLGKNSTKDIHDMIYIIDDPVREPSIV